MVGDNIGSEEYVGGWPISPLMCEVVYICSSFKTWSSEGASDAVSDVEEIVLEEDFLSKVIGCAVD